MLGASLALSELARATEARGIVPQRLATFHAEVTDFDPKTGRGRTFPDFTY